MTNEVPKKATRSRRKVIRTSLDIAPEAKELSTWPCRKCLRVRSLRDYYMATDPIDIQGTGHTSICKDCIEDLYNKFYSSERSLDKTILKLCKILNCKFDSGVVEIVRKEIATFESKGKSVSGIFGIYRKNLVTGSAGFGGFGKDGEDLTFQEPANRIVTDPLVDTDKDADYLRKFWGDDLDFKDYAFLEREYANFTENHPDDTYAQKTLLKRVCFKLLAISKKKEESTGQLEKELQILMESLAISPKMAKAVDSDKSVDCFGKWIADIEQQEPAQWLEGEGHEMFRDVADVEGYFQKYFVRPLRNAILQSKDFNIDDEIEDGEDYDPEEGLNDGDKQTLSEQ